MMSCSYAHEPVFANLHQLQHEAMVSPDTSDRIELQVFISFSCSLTAYSTRFSISLMQLSLVDGSVSQFCLFGSGSESLCNSTVRMEMSAMGGQAQHLAPSEEQYCEQLCKSTTIDFQYGMDSISA